jgi:hypothetical protein
MTEDANGSNDAGNVTPNTETTEPKAENVATDAENVAPPSQPPENDNIDDIEIQIWAKAFKETVLTVLPIKEVKELFRKEDHTEKELKALTGLLIIQDMFDMPTKETAKTLSFDPHFQFALDLDFTKDNKKAFSPKAYSTFRKKMTSREAVDAFPFLWRKIFNRAVNKFLDTYR